MLLDPDVAARWLPRPRLRARAVGRGPAVVLLHGVAFGPRLFDPIAHILSDDFHLIIPTRAGYDDSPPAATVDLQVEDLLALMDARGLATAAVVGVSGGATIALAALLQRPERFTTTLVHEPLLGPLAPGVLERVRSGAATLASREVETFARALAGEETWASLADPSLGPASTVVAEVPGFLEFAPTRGALRAIRGRGLVTSVGARSHVARHEAAEALRRHAGAAVAVIPDAGHLAHVDQPAAFADVVRALVA